MNIEILNCDCMEYMATQHDGAFDLAIVDPPYGIGMSGGKIGGDNCGEAKIYKKFHGEDLASPEVEYFLELQRISKNQIIFGANHFMDKIAKGSPCWIIWDKLNSGNFADFEMAYTSFKTAARKFTFQWNGMIQGDMKNKEYRIHPTQKPVKLYQWLLTNYAKPGQRIIDTHLGSGSSAIASHYFGCDFVGCELDPDYYKAAKDRFDRETSQLSMF